MNEESVKKSQSINNVTLKKEDIEKWKTAIQKLESFIKRGKLSKREN
jgi:hypothetical protein